MSDPAIGETLVARDDLQRRIAGSELVVLPQVRHLSAWEAAETVNAHIDRLLARL